MKPKPAKGPYAMLRDAAVGLFIALIISYLFLSYVILNTYSPTGSMSPTLPAGYRALASRLAYRTQSPCRGDIVVFENQVDTTLYVKRVVGLPGETLYIAGGMVFINGIPLTEDYLAEGMDGTFGPYEIPEGAFFVMGDNRNFSTDSRHWDHPFVQEESILGRVFFSYYPQFKTV